MLLRLPEQGSIFPGGAAAVLRAADKIFMSHVALLLVSLGPLPPPLPSPPPACDKWPGVGCYTFGGLSGGEAALYLLILLDRKLSACLTLISQRSVSLFYSAATQRLQQLDNVYLKVLLRKQPS